METSRLGCPTSGASPSLLFPPHPQDSFQLWHLKLSQLTPAKGIWPGFTGFVSFAIHLRKKITETPSQAHSPWVPPSLEYHQMKEKKANQKKMTPKRIFSAGFADDRHRRTELLFAMFLTPEAGQEEPIPGAKPSCCWRQPISWAGALQRHSHSTQFLTGIPGS